MRIDFAKWAYLLPTDPQSSFQVLLFSVQHSTETGAAVQGTQLFRSVSRWSVQPSRGNAANKHGSAVLECFLSPFPVNIDSNNIPESMSNIQTQQENETASIQSRQHNDYWQCSLLYHAL